uniref:Serpin domain-containing protein n=1 Tax=Neogobius melanostomus TaxID=47308 RepID=A0A8C6WJG6_9GOBI
MGSEMFLSKANTTFALALYKKFSEEDNTGNIFYSPFSISAALAMVKLGTAGNTARQMSEVLGFSAPGSSQPEGNSCQISVQTARPHPIQSQMQTRMPMCIRKARDDKENVDASFAQLLGELNKPDALYALNIANRLYGEQTYAFNEFFLAKTKKYYNAQLETMDFRSSAEASRININNWVEEQTKDKITNLLPPDSVDSLTKLVLVNAIYFKGKWEAQFQKEVTVEAEFRLNKNDKKTVKMMQRKTKLHLSFVKEANCQILELPYKGKDLSMIILLPNDIEDDTTGLEKLEKELTYEKFIYENSQSLNWNRTWAARDDVSRVHEHTSPHKSLAVSQLRGSILRLSTSLTSSVVGSSQTEASVLSPPHWSSIGTASGSSGCVMSRVKSYNKMSIYAYKNDCFMNKSCL